MRSTKLGFTILVKTTMLGRWGFAVLAGLPLAMAAVWARSRRREASAAR